MTADEDTDNSLINTSENVINGAFFIGKPYFRFGKNCDNIMPAGATDDFASFISSSIP